MKRLFWILGLFLSVPAPAPPPPDAIYDFLLRSRPSATGAVELFSRLDSDPALREEWNARIAEDPNLTAVAQKGLAFRRQFQEYFNRTLPPDPALRRLALDPQGAPYHAFSNFMAAQREIRDKPIRPDVASQRARENTITFFDLPRTTTDNEILENPETADFYRREQHRREQDTERTIVSPDDLSPKKVIDWKASQVKRIDDIWLAAIKAGLRDEARERKGIFLYPRELELSLATFFSNDRLKFTAEDIEQAQFRLVRPNNSSRPATPDRARIFDPFFRSLAIGASFLPRLPNEIFRNEINPVTVSEAKDLSTDSNPQGFLEITWTPRTPTKGGKRSSFLIPLNEILQVLPGLTNEEKLRQNVDWVGRNPAFSFLRSLRDLHRDLEGFFQVLAAKDEESGKELQERLLDFAKQERSPGSKLLARASEGATLPSDLVAGLEFSGYALHPNHWGIRDDVAKTLQKPPFDFDHGVFQSKKTKKWDKRWDTLAKMDPYVRAATLWAAGTLAFSATTGALVGTLEIFKNRGEEARGVERVMGISEPPKAYNKPLEYGGSETKIYHLLPPETGILPSLPLFFDTIGRDTTGLRYGMSADLELTENPSESKFIVKSAVPHFKGELDEVLLPTVDHHQLSFLEVKDSRGKILERGKQYTVRQDALTRLFFIQLNPENGLWQADASFEFRLGYKEGPGMDNPLVEAFQAVDLARLEDLTYELHAAGFEDLAQILLQEIKNARKSRTSLSIGDIATFVAESGVYDSRPEGKPLDPETYVNAFSEFAHFLGKNGRMYAQCDGSNQFLALFLERLFENNPNISVVKQTCFMRHGEDAIVAGDGHLRTLVATRDGKHRWLLDGTSQKPKRRRNHSPQWRGPDPVEIYLYTEKRRSLRERMGLAESPDDKGGKKPEPPTDLQAERRKKFLSLRKEFIENEKLKGMAGFLRKERASPQKRAMQLGHALLAFGGNEISFDELTTKMRSLFASALEGVPIEGPSQLNDLLRRITSSQVARASRAAQSAARGKPSPYASLVSEAAIAPAWNLFQFYSETNWTPVESPRTDIPDPRPKELCQGVMAALDDKHGPPAP